jgi:hypothetical protein
MVTLQPEQRYALPLGSADAEIAFSLLEGLHMRIAMKKLARIIQTSR